MVDFFLPVLEESKIYLGRPFEPVPTAEGSWRNFILDSYPRDCPYDGVTCGGVGTLAQVWRQSGVALNVRVEYNPCDYLLIRLS
jgi:hypothetical protein